MFAEIDPHTSTLRVITINPVDRRHHEIADLGRVTSRRSATQTLTAAGYTPVGSWRTAADGADIRTITR